MVIFNPHDNFNLKYILGVINSRLLSYWFIHTFDKFQRKIFPQFKVNELAKFPIYKADEKEQRIIIILVDKILELNKKLQKINPILDEKEYKELKSEIDKTDKEIDEKVYKFYDLTPEEIKIIEVQNELEK